MESPSPTNQPTGLPVLQTILNKPFEEIQAFAEWLKKNTHNYLIGEHPPAKSKGIHCHILIEGLKVSREALRKQVIKLAPGQGQNATMSETQDEPKRKYVTGPLAIYIIKGHLEYAKSTSFSEDQIKEWSKLWVERKPTATAPAVGITPKKKVNTRYEDCHEILDNYFMNQTIDVETAKSRQSIVAAIIAWANDKKKAMNSFLVADYYDIILSQAVPEYYQNVCVAIINQRHRFSHT